MTAAYEEHLAEVLRLLADKQPEKAMSKARELLRYPGELENQTQWQETMGMLARITEALPEGDASQALLPLFQAAETAPGDAQALLDIGFHLIDLGAPEVAATILARANELVPANAAILGELVSALEDSQLYGEACRFLQEQPDLLCEDFLLRYLLAFNTLKSGDLATGRGLVARLNPEQDHPQANLDQRLQMSQRLQGMLQSAEAAGESLSDQQGEIIVGGLYASANDDGSIGIWKVLAVDGVAVSLRKYSNKFGESPLRVDPASLTIGMDKDAFVRGDDGALGIGHIPLARAGFWEMKPVFVQVEPVVEEEFEGYRIGGDGAPPESRIGGALPSKTATEHDQKQWWQFWK